VPTIQSGMAKQPQLALCHDLEYHKCTLNKSFIYMEKKSGGLKLRLFKWLSFYKTNKNDIFSKSYKKSIYSSSPSSLRGDFLAPFLFL